MFTFHFPFLHRRKNGISGIRLTDDDKVSVTERDCQSLREGVEWHMTQSIIDRVSTLSKLNAATYISRFYDGTLQYNTRSSWLSSAELKELCVESGVQNVR